MKSTVFVNCRVLIDNALRDGLAVVVEDGLIAGIVPEEDDAVASVDVHDLNGKILLPGFIDAQVNGGGGILFNDGPDIDCIRAISKAHCQFGTTGFLPTLISDELDVLDRALLAVEQAIDEGVPGVLGMHIEGPFLNPERRGVHDEKKLRQLTAEAMSGLRPVRNGKTVLTLAPEAVEPGFIRKLVRQGFIVCAGHSNASYDDTIAALEQGVSGFTHLFNAMSQLGAREPGVVGAALDDRDSWCGVIADGHHVSPVSLRIACRCKGPERIMLVSDAMPPVGSAVTSFRLLDKVIEVAGGVCRDQHGTLAGTALDMASAVRNMMRFAGIGLPEAVSMASLNPASFLGLAPVTGSIEVGKRADLLVADNDLRILMTWMRGRLHFDASRSEG